MCLAFWLVVLKRLCDKIFDTVLGRIFFSLPFLVWKFCSSGSKELAGQPCCPPAWQWSESSRVLRARDESRLLPRQMPPEEAFCYSEPPGAHKQLVSSFATRALASVHVNQLRRKQTKRPEYPLARVLGLRHVLLLVPGQRGERESEGRERQILLFITIYLKCC